MGFSFFYEIFLFFFFLSSFEALDWLEVGKN